MSIRIVHTADNHVDLKYSKYRDAARQRLRQERFDSLSRVVDVANQRDAHVIVIAGDLFDQQDLNSVGINKVTEVVSILAGFRGDCVIVLPGNHDFCAGSDSELWRRMKRESEGHDNIVILDSPEPYECTINNQNVQFFPCPCPSKTSEQNVIGWVRGAEKKPSAVRIGIAHGNVEGLGLDTNDRYFNMTETELATSGVHTWLLGHIHTPCPNVDSGSGHRNFFMAGSTTPESVRRNSEGSVWIIDVDTNGVDTFERVRTGKVSFKRITRNFNATDQRAAIEALRNEINGLDAVNCVVDLQLEGELGDDELGELKRLIQETESNETGFIQAFVTNDVKKRLSEQQIADEFPSETRASELLTHLLQSPNPEDAAAALIAIRNLIGAGTQLRGGVRP